jgi:hypothetical protein
VWNDFRGAILVGLICVVGGAYLLIKSRHLAELAELSREKMGWRPMWRPFVFEWVMYMLFGLFIAVIGVVSLVKAYHMLGQ